MGEDHQSTCCPQCHTFWEDSAIWSPLGASLLDGARTCSPVQRENTHEPRAFLTLLSPGVQMEGDIFEKSWFGFLRTQVFFFFLTNVFRLEMWSFTPLFTAGTLGWLPVFVFVDSFFVFVFLFFCLFFSSPNTTFLMLAPVVLGECWPGLSIVTVDLESKVILF